MSDQTSDEERPNDPLESRPVASRQRNIRVEDALWDECAKEAARRGMKVSEFVREAMMFRLGVLAHMERGAELREIESVLRRVSEGT